MRKLTVAFLLLAALIFVATVTVMAAGDSTKAAKAATHKYVSPKKCKLCHHEQYEAWSKTPHAKAYSVLTAAQQKGDSCVVCHITGTDAKGQLIENVTCEACHGPGSDYSNFKIMNKKKWEADSTKALATMKDAGLVMPPTEATCMHCHKKEGNPHFKPFDFAKMKDKVHPIAAATKGK